MNNKTKRKNFTRSVKQCTLPIDQPSFNILCAIATKTNTIWTALNHRTSAMKCGRQDQEGEFITFLSVGGATGLPTRVTSTVNIVSPPVSNKNYRTHMDNDTHLWTSWSCYWWDSWITIFMHRYRKIVMDESLGLLISFIDIVKSLLRSLLHYDIH